jgi:glycerol uptake facilitator-like aquaporin
MMHVNNTLPLEDFLFYVVSQLAGGFIALMFFKNFVQKAAAK